MAFKMKSAFFQKKSKKRKLSEQQAVSAPWAAGTLASMAGNVTSAAGYGMNVVPGITVGAATYAMGTKKGQKIVKGQKKADKLITNKGGRASSRTWTSGPKY